jgi:hypothetical protein
MKNRIDNAAVATANLFSFSAGFLEVSMDSRFRDYLFSLAQVSFFVKKEKCGEKDYRTPAKPF